MKPEELVKGIEDYTQVKRNSVVLTMGMVLITGDDGKFYEYGMKLLDGEKTKSYLMTRDRFLFMTRELIDLRACSHMAMIVPYEPFETEHNFVSNKAMYCGYFNRPLISVDYWGDSKLDIGTPFCEVVFLEPQCLDMLSYKQKLS